MSNWKYFALEKKDHVAEVILNRPEKLNVMDEGFFSEFASIIDEVSKSENDARCVIIWGRGKLFTAGLDLKQLSTIMSETDQDASKAVQNLSFFRTLKRWQDAITKIEKSTKPIIAATHGLCIGGGIDLISACDFRFCTKDSVFSIKETQIGLVADLGTIQRIQRVTSKGFAREMAFTGGNVNAERALRFGLVNEVYENQEEMLKGARAIAAQIASNSPLVVQGTKVSLNYAEDHSIDDSLNQIALWNSAFIQSDDLVEAVTAFMQKRKAVFRNKLFGNLKAQSVLFSSDDLISLVAVSSQRNIEVLMKPQKFDLFTFHAAIDKLVEVSIPKENFMPQLDEQGIQMLEVVAKGIRQVFDKVGENALNVKISFISPDSMPNRQSLDIVLQELYQLNAALEFVFISLPDLNIPLQDEAVSPLNESLAFLALKVRAFMNCSLQRTLLIPSHKAQISFPNIMNPESILCTLQELHCRNSLIEKTFVCPCHVQQVDRNFHPTKHICSATRNFIENSDVLHTVKVGEFVLAHKYSTTNFKTAGLTVLNKVDLSGLPLEFMCGKTYLVKPADPVTFWAEDPEELRFNSEKFTSLNEQLFKTEKGLIIKTQADFENGYNLPGTQLIFYALIPSASETMLLKQLINADIAFPIQKVQKTEASKEATKIVLDCITKLPESNLFNPCDFPSNIHRSINELVQRNNSKPPALPKSIKNTPPPQIKHPVQPIKGSQGPIRTPQKVVVNRPNQEPPKAKMITTKFQELEFEPITLENADEEL